MCMTERDDRTLAPDPQAIAGKAAGLMVNREKYSKLRHVFTGVWLICLHPEDRSPQPRRGPAYRRGTRLAPPVTGARSQLPQPVPSRPCSPARGVLYRNAA